MLGPHRPDWLGTLRSLSGRHAVVWGLGTHGGGVAVVRYLVRCGAVVTVVDQRDATGLADSITALGEARSAVNLRLGQELSGVSGFDLLVVNPAVRVDHPDLVRVRTSREVEVTSELGLLAREIDGHEVIAITGSNGKSTVSLWVMRLLQRLRPEKPTRIGGNFEVALLESDATNLLESTPFEAPTTFVLEVSSFQLSHLGGERFHPDVGMITNLSPNHLDWHSSFEDYAAAKLSLLSRSRVAIDASTGPPVLQPEVAREFGCDVDVTNAAMVMAIANAVGLKPTARDLLATQPAIPHRRTIVAEFDGVKFVDDSAATTPESVAACLQQYGRESNSKLVVIAGGRNKGFDIDAFARSLANFTAAVATIGECGAELAELVESHGGTTEMHESLENAVRWARTRVPSGGVVALSPGMASTDMFADYRDRGCQFRQILQV